jgi:hypothetical protein
MRRLAPLSIGRTSAASPGETAKECPGGQRYTTAAQVACHLGGLANLESRERLQHSRRDVRASATEVRHKQVGRRKVFGQLRENLRIA